MRPHIIVGFNGTPGSRDALALALVLLDTEPERAGELTVTAVSPSDVYGHSPAASHAEYERALSDRARTQLADARTIVGRRASVSFAVRPDSSPARALHLLARQYAAVAIVVGRSHEGLVGRAFAGSVTEQTLHGAPCPVFVAPVGYAARSDRHRLDAIAVAVDGSASSVAALAYAVTIARRHRTTLRLIRVLEPTPVPYGGAAGPFDTLEGRRADALADLRLRSAHIDGLPLQLSVLVGDPVAILADTDADLLVVGSRNFGPAEAVLLGGVSAKLTRDCTTAMVVVPRGTPTARDAAEDRYVEAMR